MTEVEFRAFDEWLRSYGLITNVNGALGSGGVSLCVTGTPAQWLKLRGRVTRLEEALRWMVNLAHGVGRAGGPPESGEWEAATESGADALEGE